MKVLIIQNDRTENLGFYEQYLVDQGIGFETVRAWQDEDYPPIRDFAAFLIGGTPISVFETEKHPFLNEEMLYVKGILGTPKPVLGVCSGAQLIAQCLDAKVSRMPDFEIGMYELELTPAGRMDSVMEGFPPTFPAFHWHRDMFELPKEARNLVRGTGCENQLFRCRSAIGLLFHLELNARDARRWANQYRHELASVGATASEIVQECGDREPQMKELAERLMSNFLGLRTGRSS